MPVTRLLPDIASSSLAALVVVVADELEIVAARLDVAAVVAAAVVVVPFVGAVGAFVVCTFTWNALIFAIGSAYLVAFQLELHCDSGKHASHCGGRCAHGSHGPSTLSGN